MLELTQSSRTHLLRYVVRQIDHFFPDEAAGVQDALDAHLDAAMLRLERCINEVRMWKPGQFDALHSSQYTIFLYYLANT